MKIKTTVIPLLIFFIDKNPNILQNTLLMRQCEYITLAHCCWDCEMVQPQRRDFDHI